MVFNLGKHKYTFYSKLPKKTGGGGARAPWSLCVDAHVPPPPRKKLGPSKM